MVMFNIVQEEWSIVWNGPNVVVSLLDGGHAISLHQEEDETSSDESMDIVDDNNEGCIEASRLEQLLGRKQL
jgi:hypothetical protein